MKSLFEFALKCLAEQRYTEKELIVLLEKQFKNHENFSAKLQTTIERLHSLDLLQDQRIAFAWGERYAHKGDQFIRERLELKGIHEKDIQAVLQHLEKEENRAFAALCKKFKELNAPLNSRVENKLMVFLNGRGFSKGAIDLAVSRLSSEHRTQESTIKRFFDATRHLHHGRHTPHLHSFMNPLLN